MNFKITDATFDDGLFHILVNEEVDIPNIIEYSKHSERHFIFYNCEVILKRERKFLDQFLKPGKNYKYIIKYEKKFTSKYKDIVDSDFKIFIRNKKLNELW
jgi:hypothetical protein